MLFLFLLFLCLWLLSVHYYLPVLVILGLFGAMLYFAGMALAGRRTAGG